MSFWSRSIPLHREQLETSSLGNTLLLKLCGFINDQNARLTSVDEHHVEMRIGPASRWQGWLRGAPRFRLRLEIGPAAASSTPRRTMTPIEVALDSLGPADEQAENVAWGILYRLRSYLMACDVAG